MKKIVSIVATTVMAIMLTGCVSTSPTRRADEMSVIKRGVIVDVREVRLAGDVTGAGAAIGGVAGTAIGASVGKSVRGMFVGALVGQVVGAVAGHVTEKAVTESDGIEMGIKLDNGEEIAVSQKKDTFTEAGLKIGDRVRIVSTGRKSAVEKERV